MAPLLLRTLLLLPFARAAPLEPSVVLIATFKGEYERWQARLPLPSQLPFPAGAGEVVLGWNAELRVLGIVTGMGPRSAALSMTALGHDDRFDLKNAYFLLAGIAGIDPRKGCVGSAVWATRLVDGDAAKFIDAREMPGGWGTGWLPLSRTKPGGAPPGKEEAAAMAIALDAELVTWAFNESRSAALPDSEALKKLRRGFGEMNGPRVLTGASLATNRIWEGRLSAAWARNWTAFWSFSESEFAVSQMEDVAVAEALQALERAGRARAKRLLVLRSASNFVEPPEGVTAAEYLMRTDGTDLHSAGFEAAFEAAYLAGAPVLSALLRRAERPVTLFM